MEEESTHYYVCSNFTDQEVNVKTVFLDFDEALRASKSYRQLFPKYRWWVETWDCWCGTSSFVHAHWPNGMKIKIPFSDETFNKLCKNFHYYNHHFIDDVITLYFLFRVLRERPHSVAVKKATMDSFIFTNGVNPWHKSTVREQFEAYIAVDRIIRCYQKLKSI